MAGIARTELWSFLGWNDVKRQYNRSILGPFWLTLSMGVMVAGLGALYSQIFQIEIADYLPRLAIGLIIWNLINGIINGACQTFIISGPSLRQIRMPHSIFVFQFIWAQSIIFAHNFVIYLVILVAFNLDVGLTALLFVPALFLIILNGFFVAFILGPLCARFRDVPMIVGSVMQIIFFMTPIIWSPDTLPSRSFILVANPFFHLLEIARQPLLGGTGTIFNWTVCCSITVVLAVVAIGFFGRYRARIVYWS